MSSHGGVVISGKAALIVTVRILVQWGMCVVLTALGARLPAQHAVLTQHNDNGRTGAYLFETHLTPRSVDPTTGPGMHLRYELWAGGVINAQLLYVPQLKMTDKSVHNVLFTATMSNTVSAWDAESGAQLWTTALQDGDPNSGRTLTREGIYSTPVISGHTLYLVYNTWNGVAFPPDGSDPPAAVDLQYWIAMLDIRNGRLLHLHRIGGRAPSQVAPQYVQFVAKRQEQRPALLLEPDPTRTGVNDVYVSFGARHHEEKMNYHGWVFRYSALDLALKGVFCATPDRRDYNEGAGVWQGGAGPAADPQGAVYLCTGNGDAEPGAYGNGIVKLTPTRNAHGHNQLSSIGFSALQDDPVHTAEWENNDIDLGSGGVIVVPGTQNVLGGGKTGVLYLLGASDMQRIQKLIAADNTYIPDPSQYDSNRYGDGPDPLGYGAWAMGPQLLGAPVFWQGPAGGYGLVYAWGQKDSLKSFRYYWNNPAQPLDPSSVLMGHDASGIIRAPLDVSPGGSLSLSANGNQDGVLWAVSPTDAGARLLAFDATTLRKLWEDALPDAAQYIPPTIADGKVFVATADGHFRAYELASVTSLAAPPISPSIVPRGNPAPLVALLLRRLGSRAAMLVPPDASPLFAAPAIGERVYVCQPRSNAPGQWEWVLEKTTESLLDEIGTQPNRPYQGKHRVLATPVGDGMWEAHDGGRFSGEQRASVAAPASGALPWVLWRRSASEPAAGKGVLAAATYVQRLDTKGGTPPRPAGPSDAGKELRVSYTALYVFYGSTP